MSTDAVNAVARSSVVSALQKASAATGSDFNYLLKTAVRESGLKATAQASTSSASGLFQFVEQTWLGLVKQYGGKYGLSSYANAITKGSDGRYHVDNEADRESVLALRSDPQTSALMAGEYANQCKSRMEGTLGRPVSNGELYAAHFLGADSAAKLVAMNERCPAAAAAEAFPQAASANKSVFYHGDGSPKSVSEVYAWATSQPNTGTIAVAQDNSAAAAGSSGFSQVQAVALMAQFQTDMMTTALLSDTSEGGGRSRSGSSVAALLNAATDPVKAASSASPVRMSYDMLSSLQGVAQKRSSDS